MITRYRTEDAYGEGYRIATEVMIHETYELGNLYILGYFYEYRLDDNEDLKARCKHYIDIDDNEFNKTEISELCQELINLLSKKVGKSINYCLWLADKDVVKGFYNGNNIDEYEVSDVILADLGHDGTLYGYSELPKPINISI